jgi:Core-2/I-Branching enzyme
MAPAPAVAYLINSETSPQRLTRLAAILRAGSPRGVIAVRHDDAGGVLDLRRMHELDVDLLETTSVEPGSAAELMLLLRSMRRVLESARFDWLVLLSGSDYPVRPVAEIEATLAGADTDGFIETHPCEPPLIRRGKPVDEHAARYHYRWSSAPGAIAPLARALAVAVGPRVLVRTTPAGVRIGVPAKRSPFRQPKRTPLALPIRHNPLSSLHAERSPFGEGLECRYGSRSFVLSRRAVEVIDAAVRDHPELVLYYRDTLIPAESYIHTVLANDSTISLRNERLPLT